MLTMQVATSKGASQVFEPLGFSVQLPSDSDKPLVFAFPPSSHHTDCNIPTVPRYFSLRGAIFFRVINFLTKAETKS